MRICEIDIVSRYVFYIDFALILQYIEGEVWKTEELVAETPCTKSLRSRAISVSPKRQHQTCQSKNSARRAPQASMAQKTTFENVETLFP